MKNMQRFSFVLILSFMFLSLSCNKSRKHPTGQQFDQRASADIQCGDGVCSEIEKADPNLCPKDCREEQMYQKLFDFLKDAIKSEKKKPTTSKNVKTRWKNFLNAVETPPKADCTLSKQERVEISHMVSEDFLVDAAQKFNEIILELNLEEVEDCCKSPPQPVFRPKRKSNLTLDHLAEEEKTSPTDTSNIQKRWEMLLHITSMNGDGASIDIHGINMKKIIQKARNLLQKYIDIDKLFVQNEQVVGKNITEKIRLQNKMKIYKQIMSFINLQRYPPAAAQNHEIDADASEQPIATEIDKELATEFFFKAMQYYAKGELDKAKDALNKAHKLDPDDQEILKALERVEKDIVIKNK